MNEIKNLSEEKIEIDIKEWKKNCPDCGKEQIYKNKINFNRSVKNNKRCKVCCQSLNKFKTKNKLFWSESEIGLLKQLVSIPNISYKNIYPHFPHRTKSSVKGKLRRLKILFCVDKLTEELKKYKPKYENGKKFWVRNCPKCNTEIKYVQKGGLKRSIVNNRVCMSCRQEKIEKTCLKKYGSKSPLDCKEIFDKTRNTCEIKYGDKNHFNIKEIQDKAKETMLLKYGKTAGEIAREKSQSNTRIEIKVLNILNKMNILYKRQYSICENNIKRFYDFKIENTNILIECDGDYWHSLPEAIINDKFKDELALKNNYKLLRFKECDIMKKDFEKSFSELILKELDLVKSHL